MKCIFGGEFVLNGKRIAVPIIIARKKRKIFPALRHRTPAAARSVARCAASLTAPQRAGFARKVREFNSVQPRDLNVLEGKIVFSPLDQIPKI